MKIHEKYIKRCIEIAKNGLGETAPNPMVGCVIVYQNKIVGEGYTSPYGGNHAEVNAIHSVEDKSLLKEATIYVTLEPCSHYGKTPPCSDLIVKYEIAQVVIGCVDDNPEVSGRGIKKLEEANINVIVGVLEKECKLHHKRFFTYHNKKRPYIILKWAETVDGFIAPKTKSEQKPIWITNQHSRQLVHKWRAEEQAILVGTNTVIQDNPSLNTRDYKGKNPIRIVIDKHHKLHKNYSVFNNLSKTIVISENNIDTNQPLAEEICSVLYKNNINSVIIEGGSKTLQTFINENLWDEARIFEGPVIFKEGTKAPHIQRKLISKEHIKNDTLKTFIND